MKTKCKGGLLVFVLLLGMALVGSQTVYAQAPAEQVMLGVNNVEEKIDCLISFVQDPAHMSAQDIVTIPDNFKFDSGLMNQVEAEVGPEGYIVVQADQAQFEINAIIRKALQAIQQTDPKIVGTADDPANVSTVTPAS